MTAITGEITTFLDAIGCGHPDPAVLDAIVLVGPRYTEQADDDGDTFWTFADKGAEFLYEHGVLHTVFLYVYDTETGEDRFTAYARQDRLIDGLPPRPTRTDVEALFAQEPVRSRARWSTYAVNGKFVHFAYDNDNDDVTVITAMLEMP